MIVYLAWVNDHLLGVYKYRSGAEKRLDEYRTYNSHLDWTFSNGRWSAGLIARFGVETVELRVEK